MSKLSSDEARRIGKAIARIPEFLMPRQGFIRTAVDRAGAPIGRTTLRWKTGTFASTGTRSTLFAG